jgi:hypothetical protein
MGQSYTIPGKTATGKKARQAPGQRINPYHPALFPPPACLILGKAVNHRWTYPAVAKTRAQADKYGLFKKLNQNPVSPVTCNFRMKNLPDFAVYLWFQLPF